MRKIIQTILQAADSGSLTKIIFAGKRKKSLEYSKITLRPVTIRGEYMYQAEFHFEKKVIHQNIPYHEMVDYASQWIQDDFKQINILYQNDEYSIVKANTTYGLNVYDYIVLDGSAVSDDQIITNIRKTDSSKTDASTDNMVATEPTDISEETVPAGTEETQTESTAETSGETTENSPEPENSVEPENTPEA